MPRLHAFGLACDEMIDHRPAQDAVPAALKVVGHLGVDDGLAEVGEQLPQVGVLEHGLSPSLGFDTVQCPL
jgi:hypothetical protein